MPKFYMSMICQSVFVVGFVYFYELAYLKLNAQILKQNISLFVSEIKSLSLYKTSQSAMEQKRKNIRIKMLI